MLSHASDARFREEAFNAVWAADHDRALAGLHNATWPGSGIMRARVYARKGLLDRVTREWRDAESSGDRETAAEVAMLTARALAARGRRVEAILRLHDADTALCDVRDLALHAQHRVTVAQVEHSSGNALQARAALAVALEMTDRLTEKTPSAYRLETNHLRARAFELRAQLHALRSDDAAQLDDLCRAIATAKLVRNRDAWHESGLFASISNLIGIYPHPSARRLFETSDANLPWNAHLGAHETAVRFNLARAATLFGWGDAIGAARSAGTSSLGTRVALDADRLLFDDWHDAEAYERELAFIADVARDVDWGVVAGEEVLGLATIALVLAPYDLRRAREIKASYDATLVTLSRETQSFLEPRRVAFDDLVSACLLKAEGERAGARALLDACSAFWDARGMRAWSAIAGLERYALTHDETDLVAARSFRDEWPRSRFSSRLRHALAALARDPAAAFPYLRPASHATREAATG